MAMADTSRVITYGLAGLKGKLLKLLLKIKAGKRGRKSWAI